MFLRELLGSNLMFDAVCVFWDSRIPLDNSEKDDTSVPVET